ncbi:hypothetical protein QOT17_006392 [Balamuthia mandrillaris]
MNQNFGATSITLSVYPPSQTGEGTFCIGGMIIATAALVTGWRGGVYANDGFFLVDYMQFIALSAMLSPGWDELGCWNVLGWSQCYSWTLFHLPLPWDWIEAKRGTELLVERADYLRWPDNDHRHREPDDVVHIGGGNDDDEADNYGAEEYSREVTVKLHSLITSFVFYLCLVAVALVLLICLVLVVLKLLSLFLCCCYGESYGDGISSQMHQPNRQEGDKMLDNLYSLYLAMEDQKEAQGSHGELDVTMREREQSHTHDPESKRSIRTKKDLKRELEQMRKWADVEEVDRLLPIATTGLPPF